MRTPDWQTEDGRIRLYCADCLDILPEIEPGSADAVVTDPPYSIQNQFGHAETPSGKRALQWSWDNECTPEYIATRIDAALSIAHEKSSFACWCGADQVGVLNAVFRRQGYTPKMMAWVKKCPPPAMPGNWFPSGFELGFYGYRTGAWFGDDDPKRCNVWVHDSYRHGQPGKVDHPTQKPLALIERLVKSIVPPEGVALDGFMGSGTTGVACVRLGRHFIGIEKERKYFDIACQRIKTELERLRLFEPAPKIVQRSLLGDAT